MAGQIENFVITVPAGQTTVEVVPAVAPGQNRVSLKVALGMAVQCTIYSPAVLAEAASVQFSYSNPGVNWFTLTTVAPVAGGSITFTPPAAKSMRLVLGSAAAADRIFNVSFQYDMAT